MKNNPSTQTNMTLAEFKRQLKNSIGEAYTMTAVRYDDSIKFEMPARELMKVNTVGIAMLSHKHNDGTLSHADFPKAANFSGDTDQFTFDNPNMQTTLTYTRVSK